PWSSLATWRGTTRRTGSCPDTSSWRCATTEELSRLLGSVTIAAGGVLPSIHTTLLPQKAGKGKGDIGSTSQEF
ncbi:hypothetical protein CFC21_105280, partial [Triticum aestivum]